MDTSDLAKQIISKIWYYVENPENEQHSGKKLIDLFEANFDNKDIQEIKLIIDNKEDSKIATLINLIENKLIENSEFQKQAKKLAFLNDKAAAFQNSEIENSTSKYSFSDILLGVLSTFALLGRLFVEGKLNQFNFLIVAIGATVLYVLKRQRGLRILLNILLIIYTAPFILRSLIKENDTLALWYLILDLCLIIILVLDFRKK